MNFLAPAWIGLAAGASLAVVAIHTTLTNWNSFLFPFILTNSTSMRTLPVGLAMTDRRLHHSSASASAPASTCT